jgi:hypothetical protein
MDKPVTGQLTNRLTGKPLHLMKADTEIAPKKSSWLTRNVVAIGLVSVFSDLGHETATTILPAFSKLRLAW